MAIAAAAGITAGARAQFTRTYGSAYTQTIPAATAPSIKAVRVNRNPGTFSGYLYIADFTNHKVQIYKPNGSGGFTPTSTVTPQGTGSVPYDFCIASDNSIWLVDLSNKRVESAPHPADGGNSTSVERFTSTASITTIAVNGDNTNAKVYVTANTTLQGWNVAGAGVTGAKIGNDITINNATFGICVDGTGAVCVPSVTTPINRWDGTTMSAAIPASMGVKPSWAAGGTQPTLEYIADASYPGGGFFVFGTRISASPYDAYVYRYAADGTYLDGFGRAQANAINYSAFDIYHSGYGAYTTADGAGNIYVNNSTNTTNFGVAKIASVAAANPNPNLQPGDIVIRQAYGGGGNAGAVYTNDFVELYNRSAYTVDLTNWSIQYAATTGNSWASAPLSGTIAPGKHYLFQGASSGAVGSPLPTPDATSSAINLSATAGKVAVVRQPSISNAKTPTIIGVIDYVGFGSGTDTFEGSGPTATISATTAIVRACGGIDSNNNAVDFTVISPLPLNSSAPLESRANITAHPQGHALRVGDTLSLSVSAWAAGTLTYQWKKGGNIINGANLNNYSIPAVALGDAGSYTCDVTGTCATVTSNAANVTVAQNIPSRFGKGSQLATQTRPTNYGDNLSELDQLFGASDGGNLRLGITGNLENNSNNGIIILLDTKSGGNNPFNYSSGGSDQASDRIYGLNTDTFDTGFNPDYAIDTNLSGGTLYADMYDLQANSNAGSKTFLGGVAAPGTVGFGGGGEMSFDNSNTAGVTAIDATNAASATTGLEISLPLSRIGSPSGPIKVMVVIGSNNSSGALSNQFLPGLPDTYGGFTHVDLSNVPGRQYVTMTPAWTAGDLASAQLPWTYEARVFTGDSNRDNHPPVVNAPTIYGGRVFVVEDIEHSGGTHSGALVALNTADGTVDTSFGTNGRVALDAPATGRVAVRGVGGVVRLYVVDNTGKVYSMDTNGGTIRTAKPLSGVTKATSAAVIDDSGVPVAYYGVLSGPGAYLVKVTDIDTMDSATLALDAATDITASPSVIRGGRAVQIGIVSGTTGKMFSILNSLIPINVVTTTNPVKAPATLSSDSTLFYVGDAPAAGNGTFYCFNASTGAQVATLPMSGGLEEAAFGDYSVGNVTNALYFATNSGQLNAVDPVTLNSLSGYPATPLGVISVTGAVALLNGKISVPTSNGVYVVPAGTPTSYSRFPVEAQASTLSSAGRSPGSVMATTAASGLVNGLTLQ